MFSLFKKNKIKKIYTPVSGLTYPLENVEDEVFSKKIMGEGLAFKSEDDVIVSPVDGIVRVIMDTKHAIMIESDNIEILIHIGVDTCKFKGQGFEVLTELNKKITKGTPLVKINRNFFEEKNVNTDVMVIFTNISDKTIELELNKIVSAGDDVIAKIS